MRLTTWNVNGIRNPFSYPPWNAARTFPAMFDILGSDIIVMQELKIQRKDLRDDMVMLDGWDAYFSLPKHKKGYSGVGIYTRNATCAPIRAEEGLLGVLPSPTGVPYCELPEDQAVGGYPSAFQVAELGVDPAALDAEGRCLILEFPAFVLFGVYSPANSNGLRDDFRHGFVLALDCRIRNIMRSGKRVILVGDLNVSRDEQDTAKAAEDCRKNGVTHEEYISTPNRRIFNHLLIGGEVAGERDEGRERGVLWDTTRGFHPDRTGMYTHWEQKVNARPGNFGSRIDYVLVSESMQSWIKDANIQEGLLGSDHCPVFADFHDTVKQGDVDTVILDIMNPPGVFSNGVRQQEWKLQNVPAFSAKRMPEFDKRRSIKSMFSNKKSECSSGVDQFTNGDRDKAKHTPSTGEEYSLKETVDSMVFGSQNAATANRRLDTPHEKFVEQNDAPASVPPPSSLKRKLSAPVPSKGKPIKKKASDAGAQQSGNGQQSLKGFFQAQNKVPNGSSSQGAQTDGKMEDSNLVGSPSYPDPTAKSIFDRTTLTSNQTPTPSQASTSPEKHNASTTPHGNVATPPPRNVSSTPSPSKFSSQLASAEASQRSWSQLFAKPAAPLCEGHDEPCKTMQTKKKGSNQGRSFWMCARPLGPSGEKEVATEWRCRTFIWCSDWTGGGGKKVEKGEG